MDNHENQEQYIVIKSYASVWSPDRRIYSIWGWVLPRPVSLFEFFTFVGSLATVGLIGVIIPPFTLIPGIIRIVAMPLGLTWLILQFRPDGINPLKFVVLWFAHMLTREQYWERFKTYEPRKEAKIKMKWWYSHVKTKSTLKRR